MTADKLTWALRHMERGLTVYPSKPDSKNNLGGKREWRLARDRAEAARIWAKSDCNIKAYIQRGFVCLDFDKKRGGDATFLALYDAGKLPATYVERTANGGYHVWYRVPATIHAKHLIVLAEFAGLEIKGEGNDATLAGSVVDGVQYVAMGENAIADAPEWIETILTANQPAKFVYTSLTTALAKSDVTPREQAWAKRARDGITKELQNTPPGGRHAALIKAALRYGNLTPHYFSHADATRDLVSVVDLWGNLDGDTATIEKYLDLGAETPRRLDVNASDSYRAASRDAAQQFKSAVVAIQPYGKVQTQVGSMNADSLKAASLAMLDKCDRAGDLVISMSSRELSELTDLAYGTAKKALKNLEALEFSSRTAEKSKKHAKEADIPDKALAPVWEITQAGIDALMNHLLICGGIMNTSRYQNCPTNKLLGEEKSESASFSPTGISGSVLIPWNGSVTTQKSIETLENLRKSQGVFKHGVLPRKLETILAVLMNGGKTTTQLMDATGLPKLTITRLLNKAESWELIKRGSRGVPHTLRDDFAKQLEAGAQSHATIEKRTFKANRHDDEQAAFQQRMRDVKARQIAYAIAQTRQTEDEDANRFYDADGVKIDDPWGLNDPF